MGGGGAQCEPLHLKRQCFMFMFTCNIRAHTHKYACPSAQSLLVVAFLKKYTFYSLCNEGFITCVNIFSLNMGVGEKCTGL